MSWTAIILGYFGLSAIFTIGFIVLRNRNLINFEATEPTEYSHYWQRKP